MYGPAPASVVQALINYVAGDLNAIDKVLVATGGTPFQRDVWAARRKIAAGATASYGQLATQLGPPDACRAVGLANGANPAALVGPCHRVIGANRALTSYGGGLARRHWLLDQERRYAWSMPDLAGSSPRR